MRSFCGELDRREIGPRRHMPFEQFRLHARQFPLADREGHHRNARGGHFLRAKLLEESQIGLAVDGRNHGGLPPRRRKTPDLANDNLPGRAGVRDVADHDVFIGNADVSQICLDDRVCRVRIDLVGAEQKPAFDASALLAHQIAQGRKHLLVGNRAGVEDIARTFLPLELGRIEQQAVVLLEDRKHRPAR